MKHIAAERPWLDPVRGHNSHLLFGKFRSRLSGKPPLIRCHYANSDHPVPEILIRMCIVNHTRHRVVTTVMDEDRYRLWSGARGQKDRGGFDIEVVVAAGR